MGKIVGLGANDNKAKEEKDLTKKVAALIIENADLNKKTEALANENAELTAKNAELEAKLEESLTAKENSKPKEDNK